MEELDLYMYIYPLSVLLDTHASASEIDTLKINLKKWLESCKNAQFNHIERMKMMFINFDDEEERHLIFNRLINDPIIKTVKKLNKIDKIPSHLKIPIDQRAVLISPPPSPPIGWVQIEEKKPGEDLQQKQLTPQQLSLAIIGKLSQPGEEYELLNNDNNTHPSVVLSMSQSDYQINK